jgi:F-type H+-transporting ATPase subunit gamma
MKMVAAARLRRAQEKAAASLPYTEKVREVLASVANHASDLSHPLLEVREVKNIGYLVLSADKGLAGAYSSNVIKEVLPSYYR